MDEKQRLDKSIKWGWFWLGYAVFFLVAELVFFFLGSISALFFAGIFLVLVVMNALLLRWKYQERWYRFGPKR
jgi:hypothetical protein